MNDQTIIRTWIHLGCKEGYRKVLDGQAMLWMAFSSRRIRKGRVSYEYETSNTAKIEEVCVLPPYTVTCYLIFGLQKQQTYPG